MPVDLTTALAVGRLSLGAALAVAPSRTLRPWFGRDLGAEARAVARMLGARDLVLGAWLLDARGSGGVRAAAVAGAVADGADALVALTLARRRTRSLAVATLALAGSVAGMRVARQAADSTPAGSKLP